MAWATRWGEAGPHGLQALDAILGDILHRLHKGPHKEGEAGDAQRHKPDAGAMPKDENRMNAQTSAGMLRKKVANPRTTLANRGKGETFSLPNSETKKARMAATVCGGEASASVTTTLSSTPGMRLALGKAGGRKSWVINSQKASPLATSTAGLNSVRMLHTTNSASAAIRKPECTVV